MAELHDSILDWPKGYNTQVNGTAVPVLISAFQVEDPCRFPHWVNIGLYRNS